MKSIYADSEQCLKQSEQVTNAEQILSARRIVLYLLVNFVFCLLTVSLEAFVPQSGHAPTCYLILLFALCSLPVFLVTKHNGSFSLLVLAGPVLFMFYGFTDVVSYFIDIPSQFKAPPGSMLTTAELAILCGLICLFLGYIFGAKLFSLVSDKYLRVDWGTWSLVLMSLVCLFLGIFSTWYFQTSVNYYQEVNYNGPFGGGLIVFGRMMEPVGAVLISYAYNRTKSKTLLYVVFAIALAKLPLGIILNSKEIGISFIVIFIITTWIYAGKMPIRWFFVAALVFVFYFPLSYAYRTTLYKYQVSVYQSLNKIDKYLKDASKANKKTSSLEAGVRSVVSRTNLKSQMDLIIAKTGKSVRFQKGHTLAPLPFFLIPRFIWPKKPSVNSGQLFNREFHISANPNTYISTSFLGELYWNFGWAGIVFGMTCIGIFWGGIGAVTDLTKHHSAARTLILIIAVYLLVLRFETGLAQQTILFLRSSLIIFALQFLLSKKQNIITN